MSFRQTVDNFFCYIFKVKKIVGKYFLECSSRSKFTETKFESVSLCAKNQ